MRILLTNDDGINAEGIKTLESVLLSCNHEVIVVAPGGERSMMSHSMRFPSPSAVTVIDERHFAVDGMPADCVYLVFNSNFIGNKAFDFVISGINKGYNLASDVIFSGTYNAAQEGAIYGIRAIAVAAENSQDISNTYRKASSFIVEKLESFFNLLTSEFVLNVNVPEKGEWGSFEVAALGKIKHKDKDHLVDSQHAAFFSTCDRISCYRTDHTVVNDGIISLTAVNVSPQLNLKAMKELLGKV